MVKLFFPGKFPFSRFVVRDRSMEPYLFDGDRVLTFNWLKVKAGDVIVFSLPKSHPESSSSNLSDLGIEDLTRRRILRFFTKVYPRAERRVQNDKMVFFVKRVRRVSGDKYLVKRVEKIMKGLIYIRGDNIEMSSDMQPIRSAQVVGRVIFKY